jgi:hypothetical protein
MSEVNWAEPMLKVLLAETRAALERERALADELGRALEDLYGAVTIGSLPGHSWSPQNLALMAWRGARKSVGQVADGDAPPPTLNKNPRGSTDT